MNVLLENMLQRQLPTVVDENGTKLKGQFHEIFDFWFFSWISFPQAPEYTIRAVSIFFPKIRGDIRSSRCNTGVIDTGGKFATGINESETGGKICRRCCWYRWFLDLRISKIRNGPNGIIWGWGETDSWEKTRSQKSRDTVPLNGVKHRMLVGNFHVRVCASGRESIG